MKSLAGIVEPGRILQRPTAARATMRRLRGHPSLLVGSGVTLAVLLFALTVPLLSLADRSQQNMGARLRPPSLVHPLGTDGYGREMWVLVLRGTVSGVVVGIGAVFLGGTVGGALGLVSGFRGGVPGEVIMRAMDLLLALPLLVLALAIMAFLGQSLLNVILAVAVVNVPVFARTGRATTLQVLTRDYVAAARALGANDRRIMLRHVLPNMVAPLIVVATLKVGSAILLEATLSFLGLGPGEDVISWGQIIDHGRVYLQSAPWIALAAGGAISVTVLGLNLMGDGLRDLLDPRSRVHD
jgi:peptide/nickel transport system permease protein